MMISARNQIDACIEKVEHGAVSAHVVLKTAEGVKLTASIAERAVSAMHLAAGEGVVAFFKASHVLVATDWAMGVSARNKLRGKVELITPGAVNAEVVIRLDEGGRVIAVISNRAVDDLRLTEGMAITALIKASDVMVAK